MAKAACASCFNTSAPRSHAQKAGGQDVGIVTSQESTKCCLRIPPNVLGFFGGFFAILTQKPIEFLTEVIS